MCFGATTYFSDERNNMMAAACFVFSWEENVPLSGFILCFETTVFVNSAVLVEPWAARLGTARYG